MAVSNYEIGQQLRHARKLRSLSQQDVGAALGVSFQQVQKYEIGRNRISVESMLLLKDKLGIDLFGLLTHEQQQARAASGTTSLDDIEYDLLRNFREIKDSNLQRKVLQLIKSISGD